MNRQNPALPTPPLGAPQMDAELLSKLAATLQAPLARLARTLNEVPGRLVRTLAAVRDAKQTIGA